MYSKINWIPAELHDFPQGFSIKCVHVVCVCLVSDILATIFLSPIVNW